MVKITFDKIAYGCQVKRLGSLMDLSPVLCGMQRHFAGRIALLPQSPQADQLYRYWLRYVVENDLAVDYRRLPPGEIKQQLERDKVVVLHLADDNPSSRCSYTTIHETTGENSFRIGRSCFSSPTSNLFSPLPFVCGNREKFIDLAISDDSVDWPKFINIARRMLKEAWLREHDPDVLEFKIPSFPVLWTTNIEVEAAKDFFRQHQLSSANTIGMHLTAGSCNVFEEVWSRSNFLEVGEHFIHKGFDILLIGGNFVDINGSNLPNNSHNHLLQEMQRNFAHPDKVHIFQGETLIEAEIIRNCHAFLSAETGPAHLASAVGTPKVTIAATDHQATLFLLTGPKDYGFISNFIDDERNWRLPSARVPDVSCKNVIDALTNIATRPFNALPPLPSRPYLLTSSNDFLEVTLI